MSISGWSSVSVGSRSAMTIASGSMTIAMTFEPEFVKLNQQLRDLIVVARATAPTESTAP